MANGFNAAAREKEILELRSENGRLRASLTEMLADLDDPEMIEISAATIARARQAIVNIQQSSGDRSND